jgi:hypothetical protein
MEIKYHAILFIMIISELVSENNLLPLAVAFSITIIISLKRFKTSIERACLFYSLNVIPTQISLFYLSLSIPSLLLISIVLAYFKVSIMQSKTLVTSLNLGILIWTSWRFLDLRTLFIFFRYSLWYYTLYQQERKQIFCTKSYTKLDNNLKMCIGFAHDIKNLMSR